MRFSVHNRSALSLCEKAQPLWSSQIQDLTTLQQSHPDSILIALDTESLSQTTNGHQKPCQTVSEVGIAILRLNGPITQPYEGIMQMHHEGGVDAITVQVRERSALPKKEKLIGEVIKSSPGDVASVIESILSKHNGPRILIGFSLFNEFKWMIEECPAIIPYFTAWLDVQDFVMQRRKDFAADAAKIDPLGLSDVLKAMKIRDARRYWKTHYAVNDALRSLIVLCGLASDPCLLSDMRSKPATRTAVQCYSQLKYEGNKHLFIARIATVDGGKLPPWAPYTVAKHFASHADLKAVGLNWRTEKDKSEGVRFWQLSFHTAGSLDNFVVEINGSTLNATKLSVTRLNVQERLERTENRTKE